MIPYGRQFIDEDDVRSVTEALQSAFLTTGPRVTEFEEAFAARTSARYAVAVSSGTAALHSAMYAVGLTPGAEVIVSPMTFAATANSIVYQGGTPVFADVDPETLLIDPEEVKKKITPATKGIIAIDFAGQPCDYDRLHEIAQENNLWLLVDGCHALGGEYKDKQVGTLGDMTVFSFHPVKHITTGEGGMITTNSEKFQQRLKLFRNHGVASDFRQREALGTWFYEMVDLGYNYRLSDIHAALGISQLRKLTFFLERRLNIAKTYDEALANIPGITPLKTSPGRKHAYHLYVVKIDEEIAGITRKDFFMAMRDNGIGVNVHYYPVHLHPFYREKFGCHAGLCPVAEKAYDSLVSLPLFPGLTDNEVAEVIDAIRKTIHP